MGKALPTATEGVAAIAAGHLTAEAWTQACLDRIDARDAAVHAWSWIDREGALAAARAIDGGAVRGPLHGVPIAFKDVIDAAGMPTTHGSPIFADAVADSDAEGVRRLRAAGAVILGKTVTAEFATYSPGPTVNPRRAGHTPGGSSSGSAAAVADRQAPIALGTQTAGSILRPASFCGTIGFKPSFGRYPVQGVLETAPSLDTLGFFAGSLDDVLLVDAVLSGDGDDPAESGPPVIGLCRSPAWSLADDAMQAAFLAFAETLRTHGLEVVDIDLPAAFDALSDAQTLIHRREAYRALGAIRAEYPDRVSESFRALIDAGAADSEEDYKHARAVQGQCKLLLGEVFARVDMLLAPSARGVAPEGIGATGDPAFQRMWTAAGVPCLGFPVAWTPEGLPLGLQLIGAPWADRAFLKSARHVLAHAAFKED